MVHPKYLVGALALLMLLQAGCAPADRSPSDGGGEPSGQTQAPGGAETDSRQYAISLDSRTQLVFAADGSRVEPERQFAVLYDLLTGLPQCQKHTVVEDTGVDNEYGDPVLRRTTALYDMDGGLLRDYEEIDYDAAFGDYLIRHTPRGFAVDVSMLPEGYTSALWNWKTGETALEGIERLQPLDESGQQMMACDLNSYLLGVIDRQANVVAGFPLPAEYYYASVWNGHIIADTYSYTDPVEKEDRKEVLLTADLQPILSRNTLNGGFYGLRGPYLLYREGEEQGIMDETGQTLFTVPAEVDLDYYDGELVILNRRTRTQDDLLHSCRLLKNDGTELAAGYDSLESMTRSDDEAPAQQFLGRRGSTVEILDREGAVLLSKELPGVNGFNCLGNGFIVAYMEDGGEALLNEQLEVLIEPGRYRWFQRLSSWQEGSLETYDLLKCAYYMDPENYEGMRYDILDFELNKVATDLTAIGDVGPDRMAVIRGFSAGLMDFHGNWIAKESIFQRVNDDTNDWSDFI